MTREQAVKMVRKYGAAIQRGDFMNAAIYGIELVEALMKVPDQQVRRGRGICSGWADNYEDA